MLQACWVAITQQPRHAYTCMSCLCVTPIYNAGYFLTKIFHPNVSKTGEICVNVLKRDWKSDLGLRHVLVIIRCFCHSNYLSAFELIV